MRAMLVRSGKVQNMSSLIETRLFRIGGLIAGFGLGQGSMFLAQSWLVATGRIAMLGEIGLGLAVLSLVQWAADWGGTLLLSRHAATEESLDYIRSAIAVRVCLIAPILGVTVVAAAYTQSPLVSGMIWGGSGAGLFWAFNLTGYLDGKAKSTLSGPISGLAWLTAAIGLIVAPTQPQFYAGMVIGSCYAAGTAATVFIHYAIAARTGVPISPGAPTIANMRRFAVEATLYCLSDLPAQIYGRSIILVVTSQLGVQIAGIYVYIRQIVIAVAQGLNIMTRVEFPRIARHLRESVTNVGTILEMQVASIVVAILIALSLVMFAIYFPSTIPPDFKPILQYLPLFSVLIPLGLVSLVLGQAIVVQRATIYYALVMLTSMIISIISIFTLVGLLGLLSIALIESMMYIMQITFFVTIHYYIRRSASSAL